MTTNLLKPASEWRRGWTVMLASMFGVSLQTIHIYSTGLFFQPIEREFGWNRGEIAGALAIPSVIAFLLTPTFARLIDRFGARKIALPGILLYCFAVAILSFTTSSITSWWLLWTFFGLSLAVLSPAVWSTGVASWFDKNRAVALAITFCGTGIGAMVVPILTNRLINAFGWRGGFIGLAIVGLCVALPLAILFFFDARHDAGHFNRGTDKAAAVANQPGMSVRAGLRSRYFFRLGWAAFAGTAAIVGMVVHLVPMLNTYGMERTTAAWLAGLVGIPSIIGRLSIGYLLDRFSGPIVGACSISLPILSVALLLLFPGSIPAAVVAILILGLSIGGEYDAVIYLSTRYFGLRNFGGLFGYIAALITLGLGVGPAIGGYLFDYYGSYLPYLAMLVPMWALSGLALATLGPVPEFTPEHQQ